MTNDGIKNLGEEAIITSIVPWLNVDNIVNAVDFYKAALGAIEVYRMEEPDGVLQVARLSVDNADFWLSEGHAGDQTGSEKSIRMILTVADPDALFNRALAAGATQIFPVGEQYGWRLGRISDPFGHHWEIGKPLTT